MILLLTACVGLTWILKYATILDPIRRPIKALHPKLNELFNCSLCLGIWSGAAIGLFAWYYINLGIISVLFPFSSAALSWFFDCLIDYIQLQQLRAERELDTKKR